MTLVRGGNTDVSPPLTSYFTICYSLLNTNNNITNIPTSNSHDKIIITFRLYNIYTTLLICLYII